MGQHIVNTPVIYVLKNKYVDVSRKLKLLHCVDESQCLCGLWPLHTHHRRDEALFSSVCVPCASVDGAHILLSPNVCAAYMAF